MGCGSSSSFSSQETKGDSFHNLSIDPSSPSSKSKSPSSPSAKYVLDDKENIIATKGFEVLKVLGRGSFGKVVLVKKKKESSGEGDVEADKFYAIKILKKLDLYKKDQIAHTETERYVLEHVVSPFIIKMYCAFSNRRKLFFVMDFMLGGELYRVLKTKGRIDEFTSTLYGAELVLALESLHSADIIYRDMKPENIMLDEKGHIRLIDFGLAKTGIAGSGEAGDTKTLCGTPEYLAPEIIKRTGYGKAADWWALGSILFEMMTGTLPFIHQNIDKMYNRICLEELEFPRNKDTGQFVLSIETMGLLRGLLTKDIPGWLK